MSLCTCSLFCTTYILRTATHLQIGAFLLCVANKHTMHMHACMHECLPYITMKNAEMITQHLKKAYVPLHTGSFPVSCRQDGRFD